MNHRNISIKVLDNEENAVSGATVILDNDTENTKTTGSAGGCTGKLTDGEHTITVVKEGYEDKTSTVIVSEDNTTFEIILTAL